MSFELLSKRFTPRGWPAEVEVRELTADDVMPFFYNGAPEPHHMQKVMVALATFTAEGERMFDSPEAVGKLPARLMIGLAQVTAEVMRLNVPQMADDTERPT